MTLQKGMVSGLSGISSGISFRLSQSNWYRKPLKHLQKWTRQWAHWQLPSMIISLQVSTAANFPLCTGNMEAFGFQIWVECKELLQISLAFVVRGTSAMQSVSAGSIASDSRAGVNALAPGRADLWFADLDESAWRGLPLTRAQGNDVHAGSNIAFSLEDWTDRNTWS